MAGLFDYEDPESVGRMAFAAGLLNAAGPQRMPVSVGQALSQGLIGRQQAASEAGQNLRRNRLTDAQIAKMQQEAKYGNAPASVRTALWYANEATPAQKSAFQASVRSQEKTMIGGVLYVKDFDSQQWRPANPLEQQLSVIEQSAGRQEQGKQDVAARYDLQPVVDPVTKQDMFTNRSTLLQGMGAIPQQRPALSAFNQPGLAGAPQQGQFPSGYANPDDQAKAERQFHPGGVVPPGGFPFNNVPQDAPRIGPQAQALPPQAGEADRAARKVTAETNAKASAEAGVGLPKLIDDTAYAIELLGKLKTHPGMPFAVGDVIRGSIPPVGGEQANFVAIHNQVRGQAFLRAYEGLKGTGSITEIEGKTATEAIARMDRAQTADAYAEAVTELESVLKKGLDRAKARAKAGGPTPAWSNDGRVIDFKDLPVRR